MRQARQRPAHAAYAGQHRVGGDRAVVEEELGRDRGAEAELALHLAGAEPRGAALDEEAAHHVALAFRHLRPDQRHVGDVAVGNPALGAVETKAAGDRYGAGQHARRVGTEVRLGEAETTDGLAARQARQPMLLLLLRSECVNGVHHQATLNADEGTQARVTALELLVDEPVGDVVQTGTTVFDRQIRAKETELADTRRQLDGEGTVAEVLGDHRQVLTLDELPCRIARQALLGVEEIVDFVVVGSAKARFVHGAQTTRPPRGSSSRPCKGGASV